eukprot:m51a1_g5917 hypothetical protein (656) ;mRNA; f:41284-44517
MMERPTCEWCPRCVLSLPGDIQRACKLRRALSLLVEWDRSSLAPQDVQPLLDAWLDTLQRAQDALPVALDALVELARSQRPNVATNALGTLMVACASEALDADVDGMAGRLWDCAERVVLSGHACERNCATGLIQMLAARHWAACQRSLAPHRWSSMLWALSASAEQFTPEWVARDIAADGWRWQAEIVAQRRASRERCCARPNVATNALGTLMVACASEALDADVDGMAGRLWDCAERVVLSGHACERNCATGLIQMLAARHWAACQRSLAPHRWSSMLWALSASAEQFTPEWVARDIAADGWRWQAEIVAQRRASRERCCARYAEQVAEVFAMAVGALLVACDGGVLAVEVARNAPQALALCLRGIAAQRSDVYPEADTPYFCALGLAAVLSRRGRPAGPFVDPGTPSAELVEAVVRGQPGIVQAIAEVLEKLTTSLMSDGGFERWVRSSIVWSQDNNEHEPDYEQAVHRMAQLPLLLLHCLAGIASVKELCPLLAPAIPTLRTLVQRGSQLNQRKQDDVFEYQVLCCLTEFIGYDEETDVLAGPALEEALLVLGRYQLGVDEALTEWSELAKERAAFIVPRLSIPETKDRFDFVARQISAVWLPDEEKLALQPCTVCKKEGRYRCSRCKKRFYCSAQCQKTDWASHMAICKQ